MSFGYVCAYSSDIGWLLRMLKRFQYFWYVLVAFCLKYVEMLTCNTYDCYFEKLCFTNNLYVICIARCCDGCSYLRSM